MNNKFDVIVIGGGHAGVEASHAAAKMGSKTLLLTLNKNQIASMPCNPSIGGLGKGHIVFEISALGGLMTQLCSKAYLQARMLNTSKGPAVQGLRLQIDKPTYSKLAFETLSKILNLYIYDGMCTQILIRTEGSKKIVTGIKTASGEIFFSSCVIVTTGTFLNGVIHIGKTRYKAGQRGEASGHELSESISELIEAPISRFKTGTPPRLLSSSIDFTKLERQPSQKLNYLYEFDDFDVKEKSPCYITKTNEKTHDLIRRNIHLSALYGGTINGIGPRYCPSIEDKIKKFPHQSSHHVFIEPEGYDNCESYPAGLSTSLPLEIQIQYIHSIKGLEKAVITKCGYAIEYDFFQPTNLKHTLETKKVEGLFLAGQINGTTGYEEAAGQGIIAGINANLKHKRLVPFTLSRTESYIGILIDDIITLGVDEPYRMFTSRAERRLILRQDNSFLRLMPHGRRLGMIPDKIYEKFLKEKEIIEKGIKLINAPENYELFRLFQSVEFTDDVKSQCRKELIKRLENKDITEYLSSRALLSIHAEIRYHGYIEKEKKEIEKTIKFAEMTIPHSIKYKNMPGLTKEMQQKLESYRPSTIAQAQLIPGMTPAAISILIFQTRIIGKELV